MKLELKHLAPYLPYGLKCTNSKENYLQTGEDRTGILEQLSVRDDDDCVIMGKNGYFLVHYSEIVPILRPLSDLTKSINDDESNATYSAFLKMHTKEDLEYSQTMTLGLDYENVRQLFEWHFDVFGLIEKGLAIDINTLDK